MGLIKVKLYFAQLVDPASSGSGNLILCEVLLSSLPGVSSASFMERQQRWCIKTTPEGWWDRQADLGQMGAGSTPERGQMSLLLSRPRRASQNKLALDYTREILDLWELELWRPRPMQKLVRECTLQKFSRKRFWYSGAAWIHRYLAELISRAELPNYLTAYSTVPLTVQEASQRPQGQSWLHHLPPPKLLHSQPSPPHWQLTVHFFEPKSLKSSSTSLFALHLTFQYSGNPVVPTFQIYPTYPPLPSSTITMLKQALTSHWIIAMTSSHSPHLHPYSFIIYSHPRKPEWL